MDQLLAKKIVEFKSSFKITDKMSEKIFVIPPNRVRYLSEISEVNRNYNLSLIHI